MKHEGQQVLEPLNPCTHTYILTFRLHQILHNILLALVKRELARQVEAFFALYFDWLLGGDHMRGVEMRDEKQNKWVSIQSTAHQQLANTSMQKKKEEIN